MEFKGFSLTKDDLRRTAFKFAEQVENKYRFNVTWL